MAGARFSGRYREFMPSSGRVIRSGRRSFNKETRDAYFVRTGTLPEDGEVVGRFLGWRHGELLRCLRCSGVFRLGMELVDPRDGRLVCPCGDCDGTASDWRSMEPLHSDR